MLKTIQDVASISISQSATIREMLVAMDRAALGVMLVVDSERRLAATITDGDVRRSLLHGLELSDQISTLLSERKIGRPITRGAGASQFDLEATLRQHQVRHLPLIDADGRVTALVIPAYEARQGGARALIMAGGFGNRLAPLTDDTPKPMLPVRGRPMMSWIIDKIVEAEIEEVFVSLHYRGDQIRDYFGDGRDRQVNIRYLEEAEPRGTAGAVSLVPPSTKPLLVINADVMCDTDLSALVGFHTEQGADLTVGVRRHFMDCPFGVVECSGLEIRRITEKPRLPFLVNAGIYVLGATASSAVPSEGRHDMTDLTELMLNAGRRVRAYPISGDWIDVGRPEDYQRAQQEDALPAAL